jgi:hypothetical protein
MPIFQNIAARLHARFFPNDASTFTVRTTPRIARFVMPIVEGLIGDDKIGAIQKTILLKRYGLTASPRDHTDFIVHPTHWPAAERQGLARVRSECARGARSVLRAIPGLAKDARRMRGEDRP